MKSRRRTRTARYRKRRTSPPRAKRIILRPGQRLVTRTVIVTARKAGGSGGVSTTVSCSCSKAEPNRPDCKPTTTTSPDGHTIYVTCSLSDSCKQCKQTTTTTSSGIFIA